MLTNPGPSKVEAEARTLEAKAEVEARIFEAQARTPKSKQMLISTYENEDKTSQ
jgi:hypothetical protein